MHIAVIDDGIEPGVFQTGQLVYDREVSPLTNEVVERTEHIPGLMSHGSICAAIIKKYAPDCSLSSIKVLEPCSESGKVAHLCRAIAWCVEKKIDIIHLSAGTVLYADFESVIKACNAAYEAGIYIVAAQNNERRITLPASLPNVIGVRCRTIYENDRYAYNPSRLQDGIDMLASGVHGLVMENGEAFMTGPYNSYAAPLISAVLNNILMQEKKDGIAHSFLPVNQVRKLLIENCFLHEKKKFNYNRMTDLHYVQNYEVLTEQSMRKMNEWDEKVNAKNFVVLCEKVNAEFTEVFQKFVKRNSNIIHSIILNKSGYSQIEDFLEENAVMYWTPARSVELDVEGTDVESPIVVIRGEEQRVIQMLSALKQVFWINQYAAFCITDIFYGALRGMEYACTVELQSLIQFSSKQFEPDIFLVGSNTWSLNSDEDMVIELKKDKNVEELYQEIINYFA